MPSTSFRELADAAADPPVRGFLHEPAQKPESALVLTHGAGADCRSKLLTGLAAAFSERGFLVLRCDLPFRQERAFGPPRPGQAERDRAGLKNAVAYMRGLISGRIFLGGQSYGG